MKKKIEIIETQSKMRSRQKAIRNFHKKMKQMGFQKMTIRQIRSNNKRSGKKFPDRVTDENHLQDQYVYANRNGYQVVVITSLLDDYFMDKGRCWILITEDQYRLWTQYFFRVGSYENVLEKLVAYAKYAKNIVDNRPQCPKSDAWMDLVEERKSKIVDGVLREYFKHVWKSDHAEYSFEEFENLYMKGLLKKEFEIIKRKKFDQERYMLKLRKAKRFARDIRKKSEITKPENSVAKR